MLLQHFRNPKWKGRYGNAITLADVPEAELHAFLDKDAKGHSDYISALTDWEKYYGSPDRLFVRFF